MTRERGYLVATWAVILAAVVVFVCILTFAPGGSPEIDTKTADAPPSLDNARKSTGEIDTPEDGTKPGNNSNDETSPNGNGDNGGSSEVKDTNSPPSQENGTDKTSEEDTPTEPVDGDDSEDGASGKNGETAPPENVDETKSCEIKWLVIDGDTGEPVTKFMPYVGLYNKDKNSWKTLLYLLAHSDEGRLSFRVAPGTYRVSVDADNYFYAKSEVTILAAGDVKEFEFRLEGREVIDLTQIEVDAEIEGYITDADTGAPLEGVWVECNVRYDAFAEAYTDVNGYYRIVAPSTHVLPLYFRHDGYHQYYERVQLEKGEKRAISAALRRVVEISFTLKGTIVNAATGEPLGGIQPYIRRPGSGGGPREMITGSDGRFDFLRTVDADEFPEWIVIYVCMPGYRTYQCEEIRPVKGGVYTFDIRLEPCFTYAEGVVLDSETGLPVSGAILEFDLSDRVFYSDYRPNVMTDESGRFKVMTLAGRHEVKCKREGYGGFREYFDLTEGISNTIDIKLAPLSGRLLVTVKDARTGRPVLGAEVWLTGAFSQMTDESGIAEVVAPTGERNLCIMHDDYVFGGYEPIEIISGRTIEMTVLIEPLVSEIAGRVTDAVTGEPLAETDYEVTPVHELGKPRDNWLPPDCTDEKGYFLERVPVGEFVVSCWVDGYIYYKKTVSVGEYEKLELDIKLEPMPKPAAKIVVTLVLNVDPIPTGEPYLALYYKDTEFDQIEPDENGLLVGDVPAGEILIEAQYYCKELEFAYVGTITVEISAGEVKEVTIELEPYEENEDEDE